MTVIRRNHCSMGLLALSMALAAGSAFAHDPPAADAPSGAMDHAKMDDMHHTKGMDNMHKMSATVDAVDHTTGIVDVTAGDMQLKVHFPPASLASVNTGDKITLHLGFTK